MSLRFIRRIIWASLPSVFGHSSANIDPDKALEDLEKISGHATLIIALGIAVETLAIWLVPKGFCKDAADTVGDLLIGFGLIVEYLCISRTIIATRASKAKSDKEVAEANKHAADALKEADRIKTEASWRTLSAESIASLKKALAAEFKASVMLTYVGNDPESQYFVLQFAEAFRAAGWRAATEAAGYTEDFAFDIRVPCEDNWLPEMKMAALTIRAAFVAAGIAFSPELPPAPYMTTARGDPMIVPKVWVYVGPRPPRIA